jgi:hypothetical protein
LPEKIRELIYLVLVVVTGLALLIKYVQITTVYSLFNTVLFGPHRFIKRKAGKPVEGTETMN